MLNTHRGKEIFFLVLKVLFVCFVFSLMYIPVVIIIYQSFNATANSITPLAWGGFTFENYAEIFTNRQLYTSILDSLLVSLWTTFLSTIFGLFASIGIHALDKKARRAMDFLNDIPMLEGADVSFTFASSPADVRAAADHLVDDVATALALFTRS